MNFGFGRRKLAHPPQLTGINALLLELKRFHPEKRRNACIELEKMGPAAFPALDLLLQRIIDANGEVRVAAMNAVVAIGAIAIPRLVRALGENSATHNSIRVIFEKFGEAAYEPVLQTLEDGFCLPYEGAQRVAFNVLKETGCRGAFILVMWLRHQSDSPTLVADIKRHLISLGEDVIPALEFGVKADDAVVHGQVADILTELGAAGFRVLLNYFTAENGRAVREVGQVGLRTIRSRWQSRTGKGWQVRMPFNYGGHPDDVTERVLRVLVGPHLDLCLTAAWLIGEIGPLANRDIRGRATSALTLMAYLEPDPFSRLEMTKAAEKLDLATS